MEDRGSATENHQDHVHINVLPTGATPTSGGPLTSQIAAQAAAEACAVALVSSGTWTAPVEAPVTSPYGPRTHPVHGTESFHDGVDYGAPCQTPVKAASSGIVVKVGPDAIDGHQVIVDHGNGILTRYGHMYANGVLVRVGDQVSTGQVIANIGSDGLSTGCHLHFTVEVNGQTTDPIAFLASPPATGGGLEGLGSPDGSGVSVAHANIKAGLSDAAFAADLRAATALAPDFLSLNESSTRANAQLAPAGYAAYRAPATAPASQTLSTAVAWRTDRWRFVTGGRTLLVAQGPQKWDAGRSATWATVENNDGGQVSIVSVHHMINPRHFGPNPPLRREIYAAGMRRLQALVATLSTSGPVFVAGDFNSQYGDNDPWGPRAMLGAIGMRSTFEALGPLATHDGGGVIDYIFALSPSLNPGLSTGSAAGSATGSVTGVGVSGHATADLNSDHKALIATFAASPTP